jgi:hypothetical protein
VTTAGTATGGRRQGEPGPPRRVLLLSRSAGLAVVLSRLLDGTDRLGRAASLRELADGRALDAADAVVLDLPGKERAAAVGQLRQRYRGPLVVLTATGDQTSDLRPDDACTLLARPFSAEQLAAALAIPIPGRPAADADQAATAAEAARIRLVRAAAAGSNPAAALGADPTAAARPAPWAAAGVAPGLVDLVRRARRLLAAATEEWQASRRVRVAGLSAFALVAFTVAFAVAAQDGCGPNCDMLGTRFSPLPTVAPGDSPAPPTTGPRRAPATTAEPAGSVGTGRFRGITDGRPATTAAERRATTTTREPSSGGGGPGPTAPPTRPPTTDPPTTTPPTTAPPTTAPTTTVPKEPAVP